MTHFLKLAESLPVAPVLAEIEAHPELWDAHRARKAAPGSPHTGMSDIWVRYNNISRFPNGDLSRFNDEHVPVWYPAWQALPSLRPIVFEIMEMAEGEMLGGVLITRIPHGLGIEPHVDRGWHVNYFSKFYVALQSAPGADFGCLEGGQVELLNPKPGDLHVFDNRKTHWVRNESGQDRMTLIVCVKTDKYR